MFVKGLRSKWRLVCPACLALVLCCIVVAVGLPALAQNGNSAAWEAAKAAFAQQPGDAQLVATVDGVAISRRAIRQAAVMVEINQPEVLPAERNKVAFELVARLAVQDAEALRRGLTVSRQEAEEFTAMQRELSKRDTNRASQDALVEQIKASGLTEDEFWRQQVDVYAKAIRISKLRQQVMAELPDASPEEQERHYETFVDNLLAKATIDYKDPALR